MVSPWGFRLYNGVDPFPGQVNVARDLDPASLERALGASDLVVRALGTSNLIKEVIRPTQQAVELEFQARNDSLRTIKDALSSPNTKGETDAKSNIHSYPVV